MAGWLRMSGLLRASRSRGEIPRSLCNACRRQTSIAGDPSTAYLGRESTWGKRGRGAPAKAPIVAAPSRPRPKASRWRLNLRRVSRLWIHALSTFAKRSNDPTCKVVSDGLTCFGALAHAGCAHQVVKTGSGAAVRLYGSRTRDFGQIIDSSRLGRWINRRR